MHSRLAACAPMCLAAADPAIAQKCPVLASAKCELAGGWEAAVERPRMRAELLDLVAYADVIVREHPGRAAPYAWRGVILAGLAVHEHDADVSARRASARIAAVRAAGDEPRLAYAVAEAFDTSAVPHMFQQVRDAVRRNLRDSKSAALSPAGRPPNWTVQWRCRKNSLGSVDGPIQAAPSEGWTGGSVRCLALVDSFER